MEWYWVLLLVASGVGLGLLIAYLVFAYVFTDGFKNLGP